MSKGFILVASVKPIYYGFAINCCNSIKTLYPTANVTLFTHEQWVDENAGIFDNVVTGIPASQRAKMWAMARTPYDLTVYLDVDSQIQSTKISSIFNELGDDDFVCVEALETMVTFPTTSYIDKKRTTKPLFDGSFLMYKKSKRMIDFLQYWYDEFEQQYNGGPWKHDSFAHSDWQQFDMFTVWKILRADKDLHPSAYEEQSEEYRKLKWSYIDKYWNSSHFNPVFITKKRAVIVQIDKPSYSNQYNKLWNKAKFFAEGKDEIRRNKK